MKLLNAPSKKLHKGKKNLSWKMCVVCHYAGIHMINDAHTVASRPNVLLAHDHTGTRYSCKCARYCCCCCCLVLLVKQALYQNTTVCRPFSIRRAFNSNGCNNVTIICKSNVLFISSLVFCLDFTVFSLWN